MQGAGQGDQDLSRPTEALGGWEGLPVRDDAGQLPTIEELHDEVGLAFVDADKRAYRDYYELCLQLVRPGGLVVLDNLLFYGKVADPAADDKATLALREFSAFAARDARVEWSLVPVGDGLGMCRKL